MELRIALFSHLQIFSTFLQGTISLESIVDNEYCGFSKSTQNAVNSCPKDKASWIKAANKLGCTNHKDKCGGNLEYHCLINPWQNETVEVCAPATSIRSGHCAEYNARGGKIQEFYHQNCGACKENYMSTVAYMFQECYSIVYEQKQRLMKQHTNQRQQGQTQAQEQTTVDIANKNNKKGQGIEHGGQQTHSYHSKEENKETKERLTTSFFVHKNHNRHQETKLEVMVDISSGSSLINGEMFYLCVILLPFKTLF